MPLNQLNVLTAKAKKIKQNATESNTDYIRRLCETEMPKKKQKTKEKKEKE